MKIFSFIFSLFFFLSFATTRIISYINFDRNCEGYLKRAADSNTIDLAANNLKIALKYMEDNNLTSGFTSIFYRTPDEDIGFWYNNVKASFQELNNVSPESTQLERSNILMKLRETLLDQGQSTSVTAPNGISIYPTNTVFFLWGLLSLFVFCGICLGICLWILITY